MHPGKLGEKVFIGYVNRRPLGVVTVQFTPARAIAEWKLDALHHAAWLVLRDQEQKKGVGKTEK